MAAVYRVEDVHKRFRKENQELVALRGANLSVEEGSFSCCWGAAAVASRRC
ncbi:hypothetical protein CDEF62S_04428 [Castellaniella defragrans]